MGNDKLLPQSTLFCGKFMSAKIGDRITVHVQGKNCRLEGDRVVFDKDSHVMRSAYTHYVFDAAAYKRVTGQSDIETDASVSGTVLAVSSSLSTPSGQGAVPEGGFNNTYITVSI